MARAGLRLGVRALAEAAKVSTNTITRLERGEVMHERTLDAVRTALERAGIAFIEAGESSEDGGEGLRFKRRTTRRKPRSTDPARSA